MKKVLIVTGCIIVVLALAGWGIMVKAKKTLASIDTEHAAIEQVDLSSITDGVYRGTCGSIPVFVDLQVTVKEHAIKDITIKKQRNGKGYDAKETLQRILQEQSPKVNAVSGATMTSKCIMNATHRALKKPTKK